ncbi:MAG TPA: hypothetical protein VGR02_04380 [Thermoanaerobaculia bacterium]|nr:hypothetical protein [Thermoanaerobaculia bacterium]
MYEDLPRLDFELIRQPLDSLAVATVNKIDREWPASIDRHPATKIVLRLLIAISENTYRTIRYFSAEKPPDGARKLQYTLSAPPLARTILDALFTVVFLFEDLHERTSWYVRAGWREMEEKRSRFQSAYGSEPSWHEYLSSYGAVVAEDRELWSISDAEIADLKRLKYWPTPGKMSEACASEERRKYLRYLNDWFYRELSQDSHLSWPGLWRRGGYFLFPKPSNEERTILEKVRSDNLSIAVILLLALISEIELELRLGLADRAKYVWGILVPYAGEAKEIYDLRYNGRL